MKRRISAFERLDELIDLEMKHPGTLPGRLVVINAEDLAKVVTPARMEVLGEIEKSKPGTVGELAFTLKRPIEAVSKDLHVLSGYGLLELAREGRIKRPTLGKEWLVVPLAKRH